MNKIDIKGIEGEEMKTLNENSLSRDQRKNLTLRDELKSKESNQTLTKKREKKKKKDNHENIV